MMIRYLAILLFCLLGFVPYAMAKDDVIAVDLAENHVDITTGFNGANLILFGVQDEPGDIVITITGPVRETTVRRKEKIYGVWMNRKAMRFLNVPAYYNYASSKTLDEIAGEALLKTHNIGPHTLRFVPEDNLEGDDYLTSFQDGMIRNKQAQGLYSKEAQDIKFIGKGFFRSGFYIPANAPVGLYTIRTFLIQNGVVRDMKITDLKVAQVGASAAIYHFAQNWAFAYGFLCVIFALSAGYLSSAIRQRLR